MTNSGKGVWALHALLYHFYRSPGSCRSFGAVAVQAQQIASRHAFFCERWLPAHAFILLRRDGLCTETGKFHTPVLLLLLLLLIQPILTEHDCPVHHGLSRTITASGRQCAWIVQPSERIRACTCVCVLVVMTRVLVDLLPPVLVHRSIHARSCRGFAGRRRVSLHFREIDPLRGPAGQA